LPPPFARIERIAFLDACAQRMGAITGLSFRKSGAKADASNRHASLRPPRTGFGVVVYEHGEVSVHLYSDERATKDAFRKILVSAMAGMFPGLSAHMLARLGERAAPKKQGKVYLEFNWTETTSLAAALPDVDEATWFFDSVRKGAWSRAPSTSVIRPLPLSRDETFPQRLPGPFPLHPGNRVPRTLDDRLRKAFHEVWAGRPDARISGSELVALVKPLLGKTYVESSIRVRIAYLAQKGRSAIRRDRPEHGYLYQAQESHDRSEDSNGTGAPFALVEPPELECPICCGAGQVTLGETCERCKGSGLALQESARGQPSE